MDLPEKLLWGRRGDAEGVVLNGDRDVLIVNCRVDKNITDGAVIRNPVSKNSWRLGLDIMIHDLEGPGPKLSRSSKMNDGMDACVIDVRRDH